MTATSKTLWSHFHGRHSHRTRETVVVFGPLLVCLPLRNSGFFWLAVDFWEGSWQALANSPDHATLSVKSHICSPLILIPAPPSPAPLRLAWSIQRTEGKSLRERASLDMWLGNGNCFPQAQFFPCPQWNSHLRHEKWHQLGTSGHHLSNSKSLKYCRIMHCCSSWPSLGLQYRGHTHISCLVNPFFEEQAV